MAAFADVERRTRVVVGGADEGASLGLGVEVEPLLRSCGCNFVTSRAFLLVYLWAVPLGRAMVKWLIG